MISLSTGAVQRERHANPLPSWVYIHKNVCHPERLIAQKVATDGGYPYLRFCNGGRGGSVWTARPYTIIA